MTDENIPRPCQEREEEISLYLWDELSDDQCDALELHLDQCAACRAAVRSERKLLGLLHAAAPSDPPLELLTQCRVELAEKLEQTTMPGFWKRLATVVWPRGWRWSFSGWMAAHPAFSAAMLVLLGVSVGAAVPWGFSRPAEFPQSPSPGTQIVRAPASTMPADFGAGLPAIDFSVTDLDVAQGASGPFVVLQVRRETPEEWRGQATDPQVRTILMGLVANGQRFTADTRLKSVEALQAAAADHQVRQLLCEVARTDRNPAVRLRAVESLRGLGQDQLVQQTILEALLQDQNPGVRIEAMNALRDLVESSPSPDRKLVRVLRERMQNDSNTYIRLQSAATVRSLEQRGVY